MPSVFESSGWSCSGGETRLFEARKSFRAGQIAQLSERSAQLLQEIDGLEAQVVGKDRETAIVNQELAGVQLLAQGLMQVTRVNGLEREAARMTSERGALVASIAQARGRIAETRLQVLQIDETLQQEVATELREVEGSIGEFEERRVAALDQRLCCKDFSAVGKLKIRSGRGLSASDLASCRSFNDP